MALSLAAAAAAAGPAPAAAQACDRSGCGWISCGTPASPVPAANWTSSLQPAETSIPPSRDVTAFNEYTGQYANNPYFFSIDIQNGFVFTAMGYGLQIWDTRATPGNPTQVGTLGHGDFPFFPINGEIYFPIGSVSAPAGVDTMAGLGATYGNIGLAIADTSVKSKPRVAYQGQVRKVPIEPRSGEDAVDALRGALTEPG